MYLLAASDTLKSTGSGTVGTNHPERAAQTVGAVRLWSRHSQPFFIDLVGLLAINKDITIDIIGLCSRDSHFLMPAMHSTDWIWMHREDQILMNPPLTPEDTRGVWIIAGERLNALQVSHTPVSPLIATQRDQRRGPAVYT